jgi:hypothetical protein
VLWCCHGRSLQANRHVLGSYQDPVAWVAQAVLGNARPVAHVRALLNPSRVVVTDGRLLVVPVSGSGPARSAGVASLSQHDSGAATESDESDPASDDGSLGDSDSD